MHTNLMKHMTNACYDLHLELALHLAYHELFVEAICPCQYQQSRRTAR
jgi:hypothetical protein